MAKSDLDDDLVETLEGLLVPVRPSQEFRNHLRTGLHLASQQQAARRRLRRRHMTWQNWWLGVVAFSASIAAGSILAYLVRSHLWHSA
jgi:hypothetical protein